MSNYFIMHNASVTKFGGEKVLAAPDNIAFRGAAEGHNADKQLKIQAFEDSQADYDFTVNHTLKSDMYLRFEKLITEGTMVVGDYFIHGLIPNLSELDMLSVEQLNSMDGLQLKAMVLDSTFAPVEDESIVLDFANKQVDGRWDTQPAASFKYNKDGLVDVSALRGEFYYFATRIEALPVSPAWFEDCSACKCALPEFSARVKYNDLCLMQGLDVCAPQDVKDAYDAAIAIFLAANTVVFWEDIRVFKDEVMGL